VSELGLDPDFVAAQFDWTGWYVICPKIEGAAARKIEPRVVPVASQDAVLDTPSIEREAHVRTSVVEGIHLILVCDDQNWSMRAADDEMPFAFELLDRACALEFDAHKHDSFCRSMGMPHGFDPSGLMLRIERSGAP